MPVRTGTAVVEDCTLGVEAGSLPLKGDPPDNGVVEGSSTSGEEAEILGPLATLPHYDPLSPTLSSPGSKEQV